MNREQTLQAVLHITKLPQVIAEKITDDFINFNPLQKSTSLSEIEKAFNEAHRPGFNAAAFCQMIQNHYVIDKKTSSVVANSFRSRVACMKSLYITKDSGSSRCQWTFRGTCKSINKDAHERASGTEFSITDGIEMPYGKTMPGIEFGCECDARMVFQASPTAYEKKNTWISRITSFLFRRQ